MSALKYVPRTKKKTKSKKILYVSGEESEKQIKMRAERINKNSEHCYILTETSTNNIFHEIEKIQPDILIIDSIICNIESEFCHGSPLLNAWMGCLQIIICI